MKFQLGLVKLKHLGIFVSKLVDDTMAKKSNIKIFGSK